MWLIFGGLEGVSGAPDRRIPPDDLRIFRASVHRCTADLNRIVLPFSVFRAVSLSIRQSRLSDLGAALRVLPAVTRHWNARYYRPNRPAEAGPALMVLDHPRTAYTLYDLQNARASCIKKMEYFGFPIISAEAVLLFFCAESCSGPGADRR